MCRILSSNLFRFSNCHFHNLTKIRKTPVLCFKVSQKRCCTISITPKTKDVVEAWFYEVKPFGQIDIKVPFKLEVSPLDPLEYPQMNKFTCEVFNTSVPNVHANSHEAPNRTWSFTDSYKLNIDIDEEQEKVKVHIDVPDGVRLPLTCSIQIPIKYNINIESHDEDVTIREFEADFVKLITNKGNCHLHKLKCGNIDIFSNGGHLTSQSLLQGNVQLITAATGNINGDRVQGQSIECKTECGGVNIKSLYADNTQLTTESGDIHIGSCHGNTVLTAEKATVTIDSLDGDINGTIENGNFHVYVARCGNIDLTTHKGNIDVKLSDTIETVTCLEGEAITVSPDVKYSCQEIKTGEGLQQTGCINDGSTSSRLNISAKRGKITLEQQDWFSSLKLT